MSDNRFVYNPSSLDIGRSKFQMNSFWKGAIFHGDLVPVEITRVMPGDSAKYDLSVFIRTATPPIAPFMDTIRLSFAAFHVPERLVWDKEKQFLGENTEGYGIQSEVLAPRNTTGDMYVSRSAALTSTNARSLATYLGLIRQKTDSLSNPAPISLNPLRAYLQVYNDWFRNENFMAPYLWNHNLAGDGSYSLASRGGSTITGRTPVPQVCKQLDRYTSCLPWAQKGSPVLVGMSDFAPVVTGDVNTDLATTTSEQYYQYLKTGVVPVRYGVSNSDLTTEGEMPLGIVGSTTSAKGLGVIGSGSGDLGDNGYFAPVNLYADLSKATATTINEFRLAFATQRYLEQLARSGSKYREYIKGMFGVSIGDTTAQMAEYLGGFTMELNVDQVLQATGYAAGGTTTLGAPGATSTSAGNDYLFTKSFTEPGFLVIVAYTKHNRTYGQGIDEIYQKHEILEEYNPKFANIGEQAIKKSNLYFTGEAADDDTRLGFQEAWSEYRFKKDVIIGALNPSLSSSYNFWSLADNYDAAPTLNADFLTEDRSNITRCLAGGESSPDYFLDIKFRRTFVRPMPLFSIPGLIDHH